MAAVSTAVTARDLNDQIDDMLLRLGQLEQQITDPSTTTANDTVVTTGGGTIVVIITNPTVPSGVTLTPGAFANQVFVDASWTAPTDGTASAYEVELAKKVSGVYQTVQATRTGGTSIRFDALEVNTTYGFRVASVSNAQIVSAFVPSSGYTDVTTGHDTTIPAQTVGLQVFAGLRSLIVRWTDNTDVDVVHGIGTYSIDCATDNAFVNVVKTNTVSGIVTTFADLSANTTYFVRVAAVDTSGNQGPYSATVSGTTGQAATADIAVNSITSAQIAALTIVAGDIAASTITGDKIAANTIDAHSITTSTLDVATLTIATSGAIKVGNPTTNGVLMNSTGLRAYSGGALTFILDSSGNATFSGTLSATVTNAGTINGGSITGALITGGTVRTASTIPRVQLESNTYVGHSNFHRVAFFSSNAGANGPGEIYEDYDSGNGFEDLTLIPGQWSSTTSSNYSIMIMTNASSSALNEIELISNDILLQIHGGSSINVTSSNIIMGTTTIATLTVNNNLGVSGTSFLSGVTATSLSVSGSKSFLIDHPLRKDYKLRHACLEGPENGIFYRGSGKVGRDGSVVITLPAYFESLASPDNRSVSLTPIYEGKEIKSLAATSPADGSFMVVGVPGQQFWWEVKGVRADIEPLSIEEPASSEEKWLRAVGNDAHTYPDEERASIRRERIKHIGDRLAERNRGRFIHSA